jgi:hypothetical protein
MLFSIDGTSYRAGAFGAGRGGVGAVREMNIRMADDPDSIVNTHQTAWTRWKTQSLETWLALDLAGAQAPVVGQSCSGCDFCIVWAPEGVA